MQRITGATPSTPLAISSGVIGNINDNNPATVCEFTGDATTDFWCLLDLGSAQRVVTCEVKQWYEAGGAPDVGFGFYYSASPLNAGNLGTLFGSTFGASNSPIDTTQTGDQTARYWGFRRSGNWTGYHIGVGDFNLYTPSPVVPPDLQNPTRRAFPSHTLSFAPPLSQALTFVPIPPAIATYGQHWPNPILRKSHHASRGGFVKQTDPWAVPDFSSALLYITVNGVARAYGRDAANGSIDSGTLSIVDTLNQTPNTATFTARGFTPTVGMRVVMALGGIDNPSRLFAGTILTVNPIVVGPQLQKFAVSCIDDTWLLNKVKVIKTYASQSASAIAQDLLQTYAPGFTFRHVDPSLDTIDLITFTNTDLTACFDQLAKRAGVDWKIDYFDDLWFGASGDGVSPDALTSSNTPKSFSSSTTISDIITRCLVEGGGVNALGAVAVGDTILPVDLQSVNGVIPWYNAAGGRVVCGTQRIAYSGVQLGGPGSLVGPGIGPATAPTLALAAGAGVETGIHNYAVVYRTTNDTTLSLPSPIASIATGVIAVPSAAPVAGSPTLGGSVDPGNHSYSVTFVNATGETTPSPVSNVVTISVIASPSVAPNYDFATGGGADNLPTGLYSWYYTFVGQAGETLVSPSLPATTVSVTTSVHLKNIAAGPTGTVARKIYRSTIGGSGAFYVGTISDNTTTTFTDSVADGSLGVAAPSSNTAVTFGQVPLTGIPLGDATVTARKIYRASDAPGTKKLLATISDNATTTFTDTLAEASIPGTVAPTVNTATANRVSLSAIPIGAAAVTQRWLYRTVAGGSQLKLLAVIADNTTTTYADSTADASLGANVPTSDTSGLQQPAGQVLPGQTTLLSAGVGYATASGGWVVIGNGTQAIRYTGISGNTLTGIPATGIGAIIAPITYNSTVTAAPCLTGIPATGTGSIIYAINKGDPVNLLVQVDDTAAQAVLSALLDPLNLLGGAAGIREDYIQDGRIAETEARARGTAQLALMSRAQLSVTYTVEDPLTASGRTISIDLPAPASVTSDLTIQRVTISNFREAATFFPDYAVEASSVRMSFDDLLRLFRAQLNG